MQGGLATAALLMGRAGGPHCVSMCAAPSAGVIRLVRAPLGSTVEAAPVSTTLAFHAGRAASYALAGALVAGAAQSLAYASAHVTALKPLWVLLHAATLAWGLALIFQGRQPDWAHRAGQEAGLAHASAQAFGVRRADHGCAVFGDAVRPALFGARAGQPGQRRARRRDGDGAAPWALQLLGNDKLGPSRARWGARIAGVLLALMALQAVWLDFAQGISDWCVEHAPGLRQRKGSPSCQRDDPPVKPVRAKVLSGALALTLVAPAGAMDASCPERTDGRVADFAAAAARETPAVVTLVASGVDVGWNVGEAEHDEVDDAGAPGEPYRKQGAPSVGRSTAAGLVIRPDGYIVTSAHAVAGAHDVAARFADGRGFRASIVGIDKRTDVALLKVEASGLAVAAIATAVPCPGEPVAALGSPLGFEQSVTAGVLGASPRFVEGGGGVPYIQTDVALNPGSSGGPLFNRRGAVIGMNAMVYSALGGLPGYSLSVPIDLALRVANELRTTGHVTRAKIGAHTQPLTSELAQAFGINRVVGAMVVGVDSQDSAARAGMRTGDVILAVNGAWPGTYADIQEAVGSARPGATLMLTVWRRRAATQVSVTAAATATATATATEIVAARPAEDDRPPATQRDESRLGLGVIERKGALGDGGRYVRTVTGAAQSIHVGDQILGVNDAPTATPHELDSALATARGNDVIAMLVARGKLRSYIAVDRR
ncbi:trypsin-like peptidase domain-containing protein [Variovorax humicola]|uniref:Probable periplasmic serine endoprotease DegP-like n=1 Tax=Variovorax humicola TaxID=1769758 RepID=A0ABU8W9H6_9BURK